MKLGKRLLPILLTLSMAASMLPAAALAAEADTGEKHITILGTSDMHGNIWGFSYEDNAESTNNGMARLYTYIQQVRAENPNTILIDAGDDIQGTIMTDDLYNKTPEEPHPVITAMNYMGYDAMTLGNHEFNWGIPTMQTILGQADFPVLAANVTDEKGELVTGAGWTIVERDGVKVAIIGVVTPDVPIWDGGKEGIDGATFEAANVAVGKAIDEIGDQADVIVVSAHMGMYAEFDEEGGSDSAQKILDDNPEIDVLQVAHNHVVVNEKQGDVVIGGVRNGGRDIARFDLTLDADNNVVDATVEVVDMTDVAPSQEIRDIPLVAEAHQKTIDYIAGGTDESGEPLPPLGSTTAKFQPENEIRGIPAGRVMDTAVMDLINKVQLENSGADVSAAALFKDTSDLPAGDINYGNIFDIYKFDNTLYRVTVTGAELKAYMEWSAECYNQWKEGDINISFDPEYPDYLYDMFAGVDYEIDLSQPKGERIRNVMFKGEPLQDDQTLNLAVNNYRYSSALKTEGLVSGTKEWESSNSIRDMIVAYFAEHSPVAPEVDNNWKIVGVDLSEDDPRRAELISYINDGLLDTPYAASYNLADYDALVAQAQANAAAQANNVSVDGTDVGKAFTYTVEAADGTVTYYRLRDIAFAVKGTAAAFDVSWDNGVVLTVGGTYTAEAVADSNMSPTAVETTLSAQVGDETVEVPAALMSPGNYCVTAEGLATLLGATVTVTDGILNIATK
ncbi:bifunctional metallophosphatase/5'-nucleotidase [Intestinimonas sp. HCP28S3_D6]|uniref:bifunctional metallophosphatase/5'-nucleotidase n=1 Tax=Intestinimonas sp. HCP28S3_D6 TaxID=3438942 RepID=UPI003F8BDC6A